MKLFFMYALISLLGLALSSPSQKLQGIPTLQFEISGSGHFKVSNIKDIVVDKKVAGTRDTNGTTLIAPTLLEFATTFASDLQEALGKKFPVSKAARGSATSIFLTLDKNKAFVDAARRPSSEGYKLEISKTGITITGASPLGVWWGTRSLLQQLALKDSKLSYGSAIDSPGWATRGIMVCQIKFTYYYLLISAYQLDVARHFYPPKFLVEMCAYLSFFKQNTFHLHLSDNVVTLYPPKTEDEIFNLYAGFRLNSDSLAVVGLNRRTNESYTRDEFDLIQQKCATRGVTIIPEIEAPAHALAITQWKPQLATPGDMTLLNISHPETIPTVKAIWKTFLPWFHCKLVADEYHSNILTERYVLYSISSSPT